MRRILLNILLLLLAIGAQADIDRSNWMAALPGRAPLRSLSIPGTHDAGTKGFSWNAECQRFSISDQLTLGVRAFDLRPGVNGSNIVIYHGTATHGSETLGNIFDTYDSFLAAHPGEFLIVFLKNEIGSSNWAEKMKEVLDAHSSRLLELNPYLTVEQMRGKILVLSRDSWGESNYGAVRVNGWQDNATFDMTYRGYFGDELQCRIQDIYNVASSDNLNRKKADIERLLSEAMAGTTGKFYINHTSGYTKENYVINNHYVADCAEKCNELALNYLHSHSGPTGVILMDFAGTDRYSLTFSSHDTRGQLLVDAIIENCQATAKAPSAPGAEWVLPMGSDVPWTGRVYRKDAESQTSSAVDALRAPATTWYRPDYDDAEWQEQTFPMGSPNFSLPYITRWMGEYNCYWIRREFNLEGFTSLLPYTLRVFHDDDYKLYINGTLVLSEDGWTTDTPVEKNVSRYLKNGRNVIAVMVQQNTGGAYFDCGIYRTGEAIEQVILDETSTEVPDGGICLSVKVNKKFTRNTWTTLCLPFALTSAQITELLGEGTEVREPCAFEPCDGGEWLVAFDEVTSIRAGRPCLVRTQNTISGFELIPASGLNVKMTTNSPIKLTDKAGNRLTFTGYYPKETLPVGSFYLSVGRFYHYLNSVKQNGLRAYFETQSADGTEVKAIDFLLGDATGIVDMQAGGQPLYYDLSGRRIEKPRGICIQRTPDGRATKRLAGNER
ncbi:MAG: phosphatidylinositol-specific phospholipase C domain-containing protein [Bacteroidaceae bacterium]|nr:phosphatidylinositol-specific phospholipase C domain-containing protein [Bacteroidaceae bacterium]